MSREQTDQQIVVTVSGRSSSGRSAARLRSLAAIFACTALSLDLAGAGSQPAVVSDLGGKVDVSVASVQTVGVTVRPGLPPTVTTIDPDGTGVIIRMEGEPVLRMPRSDGAALRSAQVKQRAAVAALSDAVTRIDNEIRQARGLAPRGRSEVVRRTYTNVFNGLAARVRREGLDRLRALPGVTGVWIDQRVTANLAESVPLIKADQVWTQLNDTGAGVKVAIIDTGVDYTHPDLGGCLGTGCKVFFGWDFVNDDGNPMDDYGHGTHVAGIIAAKGTVKGVAPDARLMAIKVLDQGGSGSESDIIAGIELAANPDGDPATPDGAQVMNISLGGPGDADDPMSQAVDSAVAAGVVVAVAAGNSGPEYQTLGSPGCARRALTVGASDKTDHIASFSSRGSSPTSWEIKPEVLAPGVGITSTVPTGSCPLCDPSGYKALNGTSMATPHVAGAAALILAAHPAWTPAQVKAALMQRSVDLGLDGYTQGSGRIDVYAAITHKALADVANFNAGRDNPALSAFATSQTFTLTNLTGSARDYQLGATGSFVPGFTATLAPSVVHLSPNQSASFTLTLNVDNSQVPSLDKAPYAYEGKVLAAAGDGEVLHFPFALLKAPLLTVNYDEAPAAVWVHDRGTFLGIHDHPGMSLRTLVPTTAVDVLTWFDDGVTFVLREGLAISTDTTLAVQKAEAVNTFTIVPTDEHGATVTITEGLTMSRIAPKSGTFGVYTMNPSAPTVFHLSPVSDAYVFEASVLDQPAVGTTHLFHAGARDGIAAPMSFQNGPGDFKHVTWRYKPEPGDVSVTVNSILYPPPSVTLGLSLGRALFGFSAPFEREAYVMALPYPEYGVGYLRQDVYGPPQSGESPYDHFIYSSPYLSARTTERLDGYLKYQSTPAYSTTSSVHASGVGPYSWAGNFFNGSDLVQVGGWPTYHYMFMSQSKDVHAYPPLAYELSQNGVVTRTGVFNGTATLDPLLLSVTPGRYRLRVPYTSFHLGGQPARAIASAVFDTSLADPNPPSLANLEITSGGVHTDVVPAAGATVSVRATDQTAVAEVSVVCRGGSSGLPIALTQQPGGEYTGFIPGTGAPAVIPMTVVLKDTSGNSLTYSYCTAASATAEICNGLDDDCDGTVPAAEVDADGDLVPQCTPDCNDADPLVWATPGEVAGLVLSGPGNGTTLTWSAPSGGQASAMQYDVLRSTTASDFFQNSVCLGAANGPNVSATDAAVPVAGGTFFYLVRGRNACAAGVGTLGKTSAGIERHGRTCP